MKLFPTTLLTLLLGLLVLCRGSNASEIYVSDELAFPRELLFDTRGPPLPRKFLEARQEDDVPSSTIDADATATTPSSTDATIATATATLPVTLPQPFDQNLGNNFTAPSCPQFFRSFLGNTTFQQCLPFSLLLQTSNTFFQTLHSRPLLTRTLDATCNVDFPTCSDLMSSLAQQLQTRAACGADLDMQNPMVAQAYAGFTAYQPLYHAACLTSSTTTSNSSSTSASSGDYCFLSAVTNASSPSSSYIYYLPLGLSLPPSTQPACTQCLRDTMDIFAAAAANRSQPLSGDYGDAAKMVDAQCGGSFVRAAVEVSAAAPGKSQWSMAVVAAAVMLGFVPGLVL